jgi:predicted permease
VRERDAAGRPPGWRPAFTLPFGRRVQADVDDEIAFHLAMREERLRERGLTPDDARAQARRRFGDVELVRRECAGIDRHRARRRRATDYLEDLMQDVTFALRGLRRAPGFAAAAILSLALGIGATSAIFSVAYGVLLRPLPYPAPDRLVKIEATFPGVSVGGGVLSAPEYLDVASSLHSFVGVAAYDETDRTLGGDGRPERLQLAYATANIFSTLGFRAAIGRVYGAEEDRPGAERVIVLGHELWRTRFGGDSAIVGRKVDIEAIPRTVIGVLEPGATLGAAQAFLPSALNPTAGNRGSHSLDVLARLRPGATIAEARAELAGYAVHARGEYPVYQGSGFELGARPLRDAFYGEARPTMVALLGTVALLLLLAAVNVANLLLVRAESRQREIGVRVALGASRGRLVRQLLTESFVLAVGGAVVGVPLAVFGVRALLALNPTVVPAGAGVALDAGVLLAVAVIVSLAACVAGLVPALHAGRMEVRDAIAAGAAGGGRAGGRLRAAFVGVEVALAAMMLVGAGLVGRSFWKLQSVNPGFEREGALTMELAPPRVRYDTPEKVLGFYHRAMDELGAMPGVRAVAATSNLPLSGEKADWMLEAEGRAEGAPALVSPDYTIASADIFRTLGIPVREGRAFAPTDRDSDPPVVVVSRSFAQAFWPGEASVIGRRVRFAGAPPDHPVPWMTVVGVADDLHRSALSDPPRPTYYVLDTQFPKVIGQAAANMVVVVRTAGDPMRLAAPVRAAIHGIDPELAVANLRTLDAVVSGSVARPRFAMAVLAAFGLSALMLAVVGVYGVLAYAMTRRRREMAVRMALGARPQAVRRLAMLSGLRLALGGVVVGLVLALAGGRALRALLFEVSPSDPVTLAAVGAVLLGAALVASWVPARRAMGVSPAEVLRGE